MARVSRSPRGLAALFRADPYAAVVRVLRESRRAVTADEIRHVLASAGVPQLGKRAWDPLQRRLRADDHVIVRPGRPYTYEWSDTPVTPPPAEAFEQIVRAGRRRDKPIFVAAVRQALGGAAPGGSPGGSPGGTPDQSEESGRRPGPDRSGGPDERELRAQQRQAVLDGIRALADLAREVEELAANDASARALVHRVRGRVRLAGLEPIEQAGATVRFDRQRHESIGPPIADGTTVVVVRPGYRWRVAGEDVLVCRAAVQE